MASEFQYLPSVEKLLSDTRIKQLQENYPRSLVVNLVRRYLENERISIASGNVASSFGEIVGFVCDRVRSLSQLSLHPVVNATGVILHTNLGRAPLSWETIAAMDAVAKGYCNLEFDLDRGTRGSRQSHIEQLLCELTGAEAGLVVNNNAAAVLLALTALAKRKEVIVSRGQAIEIGGGFRIPEIMRQSGAKLVEVGTTNCTYLTDYEQAISLRTAAVMRIHSSNFRVLGFTHGVTLEELVTIGRSYQVPVLDDLGSGCLLDTTQFGLDPEPKVQQSIALGADLLFFSGDKLLGGPQAGIIVGKKQLVDKLKKHPLARAVRIDKVGLAGVSATLTHYLEGEAVSKVPVWRMIATPLENIEERSKLWAQALGELAWIMEGESMVGGGSLPGGTLPTRLLAIGSRVKEKNRDIAQVVAERLRCYKPPIVGRVSRNLLFLDPRTVLPEEDGVVLQALRDLTTDL